MIHDDDENLFEGLETTLRRCERLFRRVRLKEIMDSEEALGIGGDDAHWDGAPPEEDW